ncbi:MAG: hypothetical protein BWK78_03295 [Thiotrichaceae bacterium IS1]|nr:MAG: hypothetical protein BWK78_03295 [Thiotrichaceae bacterium IS1]
MKKLHWVVILGLTASVNCGNVLAGPGDAATGITVTQTNTNNTSTAVSATAELGSSGALGKMAGIQGKLEAGGDERALADSVHIEAPAGTSIPVTVTQENKDNTSVAVGNASANSTSIELK